MSSSLEPGSQMNYVGTMADYANLIASKYETIKSTIMEQITNYTAIATAIEDKAKSFIEDI